MNKKTVIIAGCSIIGVLIVLIVIVWLLTIFKTHYFTYEEVETKMVDATKAFYKSNPEILPVDDGKTVLPYSTLESNGFIKPLNELLKDGDTCSAEMNVIKSGDDYSYIPKLTCSDKYITRLLYEQILNDHSVITEGSGLYQAEDGTYYFKGKITNNYIALGTTGSGKNKKDILWQIMSIDPEGNIRIRSTERIGDKTEYDNRYNVDRETNTGYNDFEMSLLKDFLIALEKDDEFLTSDERSKLIKTNLCIGKRTQTDTTKDGSTECATKTVEAMMFSSLTPYEYMRASLDENCKSTMDKSCPNFNFLSYEGTLANWTLTGLAENSYQTYVFNGEDFVIYNARSRNYVYPVATVSSYTPYKSGNGTKETPYRLFKEVKKSTEN